MIVHDTPQQRATPRPIAVRSGAVLVSVVLLVVTLIVGGPTPGPASATTNGACSRDTAADLRWVSWLHLTMAGNEPTLPASAPWLAKLVDGATYLEVASGIGNAEASARRRVADLYELILQRSASVGDLSNWAPTARTRGSAFVAGELAASGEAWTRAGSNNAGWLERTYQVMLGRGVDPAGLDYWSGRLNSGATRQSVAAALWATPASIRRRTDAAYRQVLGRPGDEGGITHWSATTAAYGDEGVIAALAATSAGWSRAQNHYGSTGGTLPPLCPRFLQWMPPAGSIVRTLQPVASFGANLATLTFDDGPNPTWTPQVLDVLARYRIRATFFVVGNAARRHPDLVRRMIAEGHHVAVHTMTHPNLLTLGRSGQYQQIAGSVDVVNSIAGPGTVRCFRPPYGNRNATTDAIAAELGLATIMWSRDGRDWASPGVDAIVNGNLSTRYDGGRAVLLLHDGGIDRTQTVAALPRLIDALSARGYRFVQIC
jgi:peptidoglycan/xylan/chitin deacetylase (PgdA/CDA1 family)